MRCVVIWSAWDQELYSCWYRSQLCWLPVLSAQCSVACTIISCRSRYWCSRQWQSHSRTLGYWWVVQVLSLWRTNTKTMSTKVLHPLFIAPNIHFYSHTIQQDCWAHTCILKWKPQNFNSKFRPPKTAIAKGTLSLYQHYGHFILSTLEIGQLTDPDTLLSSCYPPPLQWAASPRSSWLYWQQVALYPPLTPKEPTPYTMPSRSAESQRVKVSQVMGVYYHSRKHRAWGTAVGEGGGHAPHNILKGGEDCYVKLT